MTVAHPLDTRNGPGGERLSAIGACPEVEPLSGLYLGGNRRIKFYIGCFLQEKKMEKWLPVPASDRNDSLP